MALYSQYLNQAQDQYNAVLAGYNQALNYQKSTAASIQSGYNQLYGDVLGGIKDVGKARSQEIADTYAAKAGAENQRLISAGLGNTTVTSSVGRGLTIDEAKAQNSLAEQIAQLRAGYQTQIGLSGLGYRGQALRDATGIQMGQLGYMGDYGRMLGQWGLADAEMNWREQQMRQQRGGINFLGTGGSRFSYPAAAPPAMPSGSLGGNLYAYQQNPMVNLGGTGDQWGNAGYGVLRLNQPQNFDINTGVWPSVAIGNEGSDWITDYGWLEGSGGSAMDMGGGPWPWTGGVRQPPAPNIEAYGWTEG